LSRLTVLAFALALCGPASLSGQAVQCIRARIDLPTGEPTEIKTREGRRTAKLSLQEGDSYRGFFLDLAIRDLTGGIVLVSVRDADNEERVVDEFESRVGEAARQTATAPQFGIAVLGIYEQTGGSCGSSR